VCDLFGFGSPALLPFACGEVVGTRLIGKLPTPQGTRFFVPFVNFVVQFIFPHVKSMLWRFWGHLTAFAPADSIFQPV